MGEGKSAALCWGIWFHTKHNPRAKHAVIRDTWENCRDTTMQEFLKWFPDGVYGKLVKSEKTFTWNPGTGLNGSVTFMGMDDEKDAGKLQSRDLAGISVDEPSPAAGTGGIDEMIFTTALTRLRQPGMQWYMAKLAQNNPDESHWTYQKFVDPGTKGYLNFQTRTPENIEHLPPGYYEQMKKDLSSRPDLQRRFVEGTFGFQQLGQAVCPLFSDTTHLVDNLEPVPGCELWLSWDGGLTPVCTIVQIAPDGRLYVLDALSETDGGIYQLIEDKVFPLLKTKYSKFKGKWHHTGDPTLENRDQSDSRQSPVRVIKRMLGGTWRKGPKDIEPGVNPLNRRLGLLGPGGKGMILVDKRNAKGIWHALRGGWHYSKHGSTTSPSPVKNHPHSDFGDSMRYLCGVLFPEGEMRPAKGHYNTPHYANYGPSTIGGASAKTLRPDKLKIPSDFRTF